MEFVLIIVKLMFIFCTLGSMTMFYDFFILFHKKMNELNPLTTQNETNID